MKKTRPFYNLKLNVEYDAQKSLPYVGTFTVMSDGLLLKGATKGLETYIGTVDTQSGHPLQVDFNDKQIGYLSRRGKFYYLHRDVIRVKTTIDTLKRLSGRDLTKTGRLQSERP